MCVLCQSEWHWAKECPQNILNKKGENRPRPIASQEKEDDEEQVYVGELKVAEESWEEVDAILDTGCKSTVCGEL